MAVLGGDDARSAEAVRRAHDPHWGVCSDCGGSDGYVNVGKSHWFLCHEHRKMWCIGSGLFSSCRGQSLDDQQAIWDRLGLDGYEDVTPQ